MVHSEGREGGFTLLEVLVALAIFAIVAAVVLTAAGRSLNNAARLEALTLAGWIADNRLTSPRRPSDARPASWSMPVARGRSSVKSRPAPTPVCCASPSG